MNKQHHKDQQIIDMVVEKLNLTGFLNITKQTFNSSFKNVKSPTELQTYMAKK